MKASPTAPPGSRPSGTSLGKKPRSTSAIRKPAAADDRKSLGDGVRRLRRQRGGTLAQLSKNTGLAISTLSKVENNQISLT